MDDAISRSAMLQDLDAWRNQLGIYTGDDPHELELWETVGTMLVQFSDNVAAAQALNVVPTERLQQEINKRIATEKTNRQIIKNCVSVVWCEDCEHRRTDRCPLYTEKWVVYDDGYSHYGARMDGEVDA